MREIDKIGITQSYWPDYRDLSGTYLIEHLVSRFVLYLESYVSEYETSIMDA